MQHYWQLNLNAFGCVNLSSKMTWWGSFVYRLKINDISLFSWFEKTGDGSRGFSARRCRPRRSWQQLSQSSSFIGGASAVQGYMRLATENIQPVGLMQYFFTLYSSFIRENWSSLWRQMISLQNGSKSLRLSRRSWYIPYAHFGAMWDFISQE